MKCCYNYITKIQYRNSAFRLYLYKLIDKCAVVNAGDTIKSPKEVNALSNEDFIYKDIIAPNPLKGSCVIVQLYLLFTFKLILKN
jgi:hypothetical protein